MNTTFNGLALGLSLILTGGGAVLGIWACRLFDRYRSGRRADRLGRHVGAALAVTAGLPDDEVHLTAAERAEWPHLRIAWTLPPITDAERYPRPPAPH